MSHDTYRVDSGSPNFIQLARFVFKREKRRDGKKSLHVPVTREDTESQRHRGWMRGTEQRGPWKPAANIEQVYSGPRERPETLECAILSNGEDLYTERQNRCRTTGTHWGRIPRQLSGTERIPGRMSLIPLRYLSLIRSKNKKRFFNHERI